MISNNVVIRGLNSTWKFVTRGFGPAPLTGEKVKFCRVWTEPFICNAISTSDYICQKIKTNKYIDMKVSTS